MCGCMTMRVRSADDRRREIQENATRLGIDEAFISDLVERFYARVRAHPFWARFSSKRSETSGHPTSPS